MPTARSADLVRGSPLVHARVTGLAGLAVLATGTFAGSVASRLLVRDDLAATSRHLAESASLFRAAIVANLAMMVAWLFYALLLSRLLRPAGRSHARAMLALVLAAVPIYMLNEVHHVAALRAASAGAPEQVGLALDLHRFGTITAGIFFALWLVPLGLLVYRSGFLPRVLGVLLLVGSPGYLVLFIQAFLFPQTERTLWSNPFLVVTHLAELALLLWLLVRGVDAERWERCASPAP